MSGSDLPKALKDWDFGPRPSVGHWTHASTLKHMGCRGRVILTPFDDPLAPEEYVCLCSLEQYGIEQKVNILALDPDLWKGPQKEKP